ncbi:MAG: NADH-quinone oxidoreductase subunit M [Candidatus Omnitrophica bacterium]|nr:NADH-quinone oxidoreductase subunit M [Candidatus Omnitrophota bacterium]
MTLPLLSLMVFLPLAGALVTLLVPKERAGAIKSIAVAGTLAVLVLSVLMLFQFQPDAGYQFGEECSWIPQINVWYHLGVDGISVPLVFLTALISFVAAIASFGIAERLKEYFFLFLLLETGMMGTFVALDLFLFYIFWELVLVPMYFLIGIWGGPRREYAAIKFFLYTLAGSVLMLLAILTCYFNSSPHSFSIPELVEKGLAGLSETAQWAVFLGFFIAFAIKVPIFPFHTWLPDAHVEAPTPISVILAGVLLKMGGYGLFRIGFPLLPEIAQQFGLTLAVLGLINVVYGAFVAMAQTDFKKMVAYSSVSHMGFVLLGLAGFTLSGFNGALLEMFNHGMITGGMFLLVGMLYDRTHTRTLADFGGLGAKLPVYSGFLTFFAMASLGLPGLSGFVSEFLSLLGCFPTHPVVTISAVLGLVLGAAVFLLMLQAVLLGALKPKWSSLQDMRPREIFTLVPLMLFVLWVGLWPSGVLNWQTAAVGNLLSRIGGNPGW